tara:strand:- start:4270 stop:4794 length:525 start_codon:yes stop_codon:yes gene_type:complete
MSQKFSFKKSNKKKTFSFKKKHNDLKKKIEEKLDKLYSNHDLENTKLDYDYNNSDHVLWKKYKSENKKVNYELINKLPNLEFNFTNFINDGENNFENDDSFASKKTDIDIDNLSNDNLNNDNLSMDKLDIDLDSLEQEKVGEKYYYFDYSKGIIYDLKYDAIGYIDEFGEIFIE